MIKEKLPFPNLKNITHVGGVVNFITEQMLSSEYEVVRLSKENYMKDISKHKISNVFIDVNIYEIDHPWFKSDTIALARKLSDVGINVIIISTDYDVPEEVSHFPRVVLNAHSSQIKQRDNLIDLPILINEKLFNPANNLLENDILYLKVGEAIEFEEEFIEFHEKFKPCIKQANPKNLSGELMMRLAKTIKNSKILYIMSPENIHPVIYKFILMISIAQNTVVFTQRQGENDDNLAIEELSYQISIDYIRGLIKNKMFWDKHILTKTREVFLKYSFINRPSLSDLLYSSKSLENECGINVSVIVTTKRKENLKVLFKDLSRQKYVNLQVVLLTHGYKLSDDEREELFNMATFDLLILDKPSTVSFGKCLNSCVEHVKNDYVIKMDDDDFYFPNFIIDIYIGLMYSEADLVGKNAFFFYLEGDNVTGQRRMDFQFKDVKEIKGNTLFSKTSTLRKYMYGDLSRHVDSDLIIRLREDGGRIYSIHPYDMCVYRADDKTGHTFQVDDSRFLKDAKILYYGLPNKTVATE